MRAFAGALAMVAVGGCGMDDVDDHDGGPDGAAEVERGRSGPGPGSLRYRLHVPGEDGSSPPLLVVLHGCTQDADDVAAGTRLDARAGRRGYLVLYPEQRPDAHPQRCWRWFEETHRRRDEGEAAELARLIDQVVRDRGVDPGRVHLAGLSAGAGMAVVLAALYPDRFATVTAHSGVPFGAADGERGAQAVLRGEGPGVGELAARLRDALPEGAEPPRLLAIHGRADSLVSPVNTRRLVAAWLSAREGRRASGTAGGQRRRGPEGSGGEPPAPDRRRRGTGGEGGYPYEVRRWGPPGRPGVEAWLVERLGHAWSGGDSAGTFTDPAGPDATGVVLRFLEGGTTGE